MAVAVRDLEAAAHQHDGAVALPLCAGLGPGERKPQRGAVGCGPHDAGPFKEAGDRCDTDLGVNLAVVLVLDPRERGLVQEREREIGHMLEHGQEPTFNGGPEGLLLPILVGRIRKRSLVQDTETAKRFRDLGRGHGLSTIAHSRAWQAALLESLGEAMGNVLSCLLEVPLQVTGEAEQSSSAPNNTGATNSAREVSTF